MGFHGAPAEFRGILENSGEFQGVSWGPGEFRGISESSAAFQGVPGTFRGSQGPRDKCVSGAFLEIPDAFQKFCDTFQRVLGVLGGS